METYSSDHRPVMAILDGSADGRGAIRRAIALARDGSSELVILGIDYPFGALTQRDARMIREVDDYVRVVVERELRDIARESRAKIPITYRRVLRGHPVPALRGAIEGHHPRILVISSRLLSRLALPEERGILDEVLSRVPVCVTDDHPDQHGRAKT
jgi:hypothetical protein